jgi:hypothetical protein
MSDIDAASLLAEIEEIVWNDDLSPTEKRDALRALMTRRRLRTEWDIFLAAYVQRIRRPAPDSSADIMSALMTGPEFAPFRACGLGMEFAALMLSAWYAQRDGGAPLNHDYAPSTPFDMRVGRR